MPKIVVIERLTVVYIPAFTQPNAVIAASIVDRGMEVTIISDATTLNHDGTEKQFYQCQYASTENAYLLTEDIFLKH